MTRFTANSIPCNCHIRADDAHAVDICKGFYRFDWELSWEELDRQILEEEKDGSQTYCEAKLHHWFQLLNFLFSFLHLCLSLILVLAVLPNSLHSSSSLSVSASSSSFFSS